MGYITLKSILGQVAFQLYVNYVNYSGIVDFEVGLENCSFPVNWTTVVRDGLMS